MSVLCDCSFMSVDKLVADLKTTICMYIYIYIYIPWQILSIPLNFTSFKLWDIWLKWIAISHWFLICQHSRFMVMKTHLKLRWCRTHILHITFSIRNKVNHICRGTTNVLLNFIRMAVYFRNVFFRIRTKVRIFPYMDRCPGCCFSCWKL